MKAVTMLFLTALCLLGAMAVSAEDAPALRGKYASNFTKWAEQPLSAVFTPVEGKEGEWTVVFTAQYKGKDSQYKGTATGSLTEGITGAAASGNGRRTWRFEAKPTDGTLTGEHWETTGGGDKRTGTLVLKPVEAEEAKAE